jgi:endonuclease/exonuclease/phosphatase family metal-dependent hydrolase
VVTAARLVHPRADAALGEIRPVRHHRAVRVLSWNLFHGRAAPAAGRPLLHEFATTLAGWSWDVALLQEVPPWWPPLLARAAGPGTAVASVLTSRNALLPARRAVARRRPDLLGSNGGGADAILLRAGAAVAGHASHRLRLWPERRLVHAVLLVDPGGPLDGVWVGNVHAQKGSWTADGGLRRPLADLGRATDRLDAWAERTGRPGSPVLLGGDLNLPRAAVEERLPGAWRRIASSGPDHVVGRGLVAAGDSTRPPRGSLSDHAPLAVDVRRAG